jgi:hypothetical protein
MKRTDKDNKPEPVNSLVRYSGLFFQMFFIIGIFAFGGYKIDEATDDLYRRLKLDRRCHRHISGAQGGQPDQ